MEEYNYKSEIIKAVLWTVLIIGVFVGLYLFV